MPLTAILRSGDLDQLTTHARLAVGRPAVTVPEDLAGSSRYRPPPPSASIPYGGSCGEKRAARIQKV